VKTGYQVRGIDLSEQMIRIAREKEGKNLLFEQADVRTFRCSGKFDAVISLFHVASYQTSTLVLAR
jgi:2-polyprenyl-3-methyl-5-hydroxy-6-metoxy-1,4-benzoquinol methylase